ncbi:MAG: shikimate dehydrogenase [Bacilli bacterium]|nr:shikimate dehydrogenase [Bacilli bacterium]
MEYGLIGEKLGHSFSKEIHEKVAGYKYDLVELKKEELPEFLRVRNFKAINVTIPYKEAVIPYLDEIDETAKEVGAVNTVVNKDGRLIGYNTDVDGFIYQLEHMSLNVKNKKVLVLGTGGASKAIYAALKRLEAKEIIFVSSSHKPNSISYEEIDNYLDASIIINCTPIGMYPHNEDNLLINIDKFKHIDGIIDLIYNPIRTRLITSAQFRGIKAEGGLYMLVGQAYKAMNIFNGFTYKKEDVDKTHRELLNKKTNIVIIGMPSSGKTSISKELSSRLNIPYIDIDDNIVKEINMPIAKLFELEGEKSFRKLETKHVAQIYKTTQKIISTGGGIIKNKENIDMLKQNGTIYYINRSLNKLTPTSDRPLSSDKNKLEKLYNERKPLYLMYADKVIDNNQSVSDTVNAIIKEREL